LMLPKARQALIGEPMTKRLDELAKALDRQSKIDVR
jgi:hypothetical protein